MSPLETPTLESQSAPFERIVLVDAPTGARKVGEAARKPKTIARLSDWAYIERSLHRLIAGWGRHHTGWNDIVACHRHVWEQAECVRKLRGRLEQFPGAAQHLEAPVSGKLESLVNTVLLAPSFQDALDGIYGVLMPALTRSYQLYGAQAHPVHDAPTIAMLHDIINHKESMRLWRADIRRRHPHTTDPDYLAAIQRELKACGDLLDALPVEGEAAQPVGVRTNFRLPAHAGRPAGSEPGYNIRPYLARDFQTSIETRRLFWAYAYLLEMNLAMDQLRWVYDGHFMPWEFLQDISRHLWDESRHGDSGHSRLLDFGITIPDIGFPGYGEGFSSDSLRLGSVAQGDFPAHGQAPPMTPKDLYDQVYFIGMCAETGHFVVKRQAYDDFRDGGDLESAEMMLFDIIDETTHVQYAHKWLPLLAERAGVDNSDYKERAVRDRDDYQRRALERLEEQRQLPDDPSDPHCAKYHELLAIMREKQPLSNAQTAPMRDHLPM